MPRTWGHWPRLPDLHLIPKFKLYSPTIYHDIAMFEPILVPSLTVNLHRLHVVAVLIVEVVGFDRQSFVAVDGHVDLREPWRFNKVNWLSDYWIKAEHLPQQP